MVWRCSVKGCSNRKDRERNLSFYLLPKVVKDIGVFESVILTVASIKKSNAATCVQLSPRPAMQVQ